MEKTLNIWSKFDSEVLTEWRNYHGSPIAVLKNLDLLKRSTQINGIGTIFGNFGILNYDIMTLTQNDILIIKLIEQEYNYFILK